MDITYTYRTRADGNTHKRPCEGLWHALNMAEYHVEQQADEVEPMAISTSQGLFDQGHILALLDVWGDPARIKKD